MWLPSVEAAPQQPVPSVSLLLGPQASQRGPLIESLTISEAGLLGEPHRWSLVTFVKINEDAGTGDPNHLKNTRRVVSEQSDTSWIRSIVGGWEASLDLEAKRFGLGCKDSPCQERHLRSGSSPVAGDGICPPRRNPYKKPCCGAGAHGSLCTQITGASGRLSKGALPGDPEGTSGAWASAFS